MEILNNTAQMITKAQYLALTPVQGTSYYITDLETFTITNSAMTAALTTASSLYKVGDVFVCGDSGTYTRGTLYQFTLTGDVYSWEAMPSGGLPITSATIKGSQISDTISSTGDYIYLGSVGTLTISTNSDVTITINGSLSRLILPQTSKTVTLSAVGYTGLAIATTAIAETATASFTSSTITDVTVVAATFSTKIWRTGSYTFSYDGTNWINGGTSVDLSEYGITITGTATSGDTITVTYTEATLSAAPLADGSKVGKYDIRTIAVS